MSELYNRTSYWLFIQNIPHLHGKELLSAINIKLTSLYPGNINDCNIHIRKNGSKKGSYLVFVLDKNTGNNMLPVSPLFAQYLYAKKNANVLYIDKHWMDFIRIENGCVASSTVKSRNEETTQDDINTLCADEKNLVVFCDDSDKKLFTSPQDIKFFNRKNELKNIDIHKISLFSEKSSVVKRRRFVLCAAALFLLFFSSFLLYKHNESEKERNALLRLEQERLQKEDQQRQRDTARLIELKQLYRDVISNKTATPFDIAAVIAECAGRDTRINSAAFNKNFFQIEGITGGSLGILQKFENHFLVANARLHQVNPLGNRDTFTLSGTVLIKEIPVDDSLSITEQIDIYESLIAMESGFSVTEAQLSPSAFGSAVNSLFSKWGCTIYSYQFMNEPEKTEIELSLRGSGNGFFNALYEIKTRHRMWDIHLTQIRNLYPRNMLDVVIRIRTEYFNSKQDDLAFQTLENITISSIAGISRNYFLLPPAVQGAQEARAAIAPPIAPPTIRAEVVSWLEYIGSIVEEENGRFVYVKDTRSGRILKLGQYGDLRYAISPSGGIIAYINENIYEINRR